MPPLPNQQLDLQRRQREAPSRLGLPQPGPAPGTPPVARPLSPAGAPGGRPAAPAAPQTGLLGSTLPRPASPAPGAAPATPPSAASVPGGTPLPAGAQATAPGGAPQAVPTAVAFDRVPSADEFAQLPPGTTGQSPYGPIVPGADGKPTQVLDEAGKAAFVQARAKTIADYGPMPSFLQVPGAPQPEFRVGKSNFNPFTGKWSGPAEPADTTGGTPDPPDPGGLPAAPIGSMNPPGPVGSMNQPDPGAVPRPPAGPGGGVAPPFYAPPSAGGTVTSQTDAGRFAIPLQDILRRRAAAAALGPGRI